jgi:hypothetical protein
VIQKLVLLWLLTCGILASSAAAETPVLASETTVRVFGPTAMNVRLPVAVARDGVDPTFLEGRMSIALRELAAPSGEQEPLWSAHGQPGFAEGELIRDLPAGDYRLYLLPAAGSPATVKLVIKDLSGALDLPGGISVPAHESKLDGAPSRQYPNTVVVGARQLQRAIGWTTVDLIAADLGRTQWCTTLEAGASDTESYDIGCPGGGPETWPSPVGELSTSSPDHADSLIFWWFVAPPTLGYGGNVSSVIGDPQAVLTQHWLTLAEADAAVTAAQRPPQAKKKKAKASCRQRARRIKNAKRRRAALKRCARARRSTARQGAVRARG